MEREKKNFMIVLRFMQMMLMNRMLHDFFPVAFSHPTFFLLPVNEWGGVTKGMSNIFPSFATHSNVNLDINFFRLRHQQYRPARFWAQHLHGTGSFVVSSFLLQTLSSNSWLSMNLAEASSAARDWACMCAQWFKGRLRWMLDLRNHCGGMEVVRGGAVWNTTTWIKSISNPCTSNIPMK